MENGNKIALIYQPVVPEADTMSYHGYGCRAVGVYEDHLEEAIIHPCALLAC